MKEKKYCMNASPFNGARNTKWTSCFKCCFSCPQECERPKCSKIERRERCLWRLTELEYFLFKLGGYTRRELTHYHYNLRPIGEGR